MYGVNFKLMSADEIREEFDKTPEANGGILSTYNAFTYDNTVVINIDKASV